MGRRKARTREEILDLLTPKQLAFCRAYIVSNNATQAAIEAGYSEKTAKDIGCQNLKRDRVQDAMAVFRADVAERNRITEDDLLIELEEARQSALKPKTGVASPAAAVAATMGKAKLMGFLTDRIDHTTNGESIQSGLGHFYNVYDQDEPEALEYDDDNTRHDKY